MVRSVIPKANRNAMALDSYLPHKRANLKNHAHEETLFINVCEELPIAMGFRFIQR